MRTSVAASCALLLFACACGGKSHPQEARPATATVEAAVAMFVEMGEVVMSAADDCELMATRVGSWLDANGQKRKQVNAELAQIKSAKTEEAYRQQLGQHVETILGMKAGVEGCQKHAGFMRAWERLDES